MILVQILDQKWLQIFTKNKFFELKKGQILTFLVHIVKNPWMLGRSVLMEILSLPQMVVLPVFLALLLLLSLLMVKLMEVCDLKK
jgi:hypothetical protein